MLAVVHLRARNIHCLENRRRSIRSVSVQNFLHSFIIVAFKFRFNFIFVLMLVEFVHQALEFDLRRTGHFMPKHDFRALGSRNVRRIGRKRHDGKCSAQCHCDLFDLHYLTAPSLMPDLNDF